MIEKPKKERRFLKTLGKIGEILLQEVLLKVGSNLIKRIGGKKTLPSILFLFLSISLFAQYPSTGNKQRLGFQTTAAGFVWRGSISDTASIHPVSNQNAWVILDTVNLKIYSFDFTSNVWNQLPSGTTIDTTSLSNRINLKLNIADTAAMLTTYFKKSDTTQLNLTSRFAAKLNISDTSSMLTNYLRSGVAASTYLPLTGGTLTGALNGTTGTFASGITAGNISPVGSPIINAGITGTETNVHFYSGLGTENNITTLRLTNNNGGFFQNGLFLKSQMLRGLDEYNAYLGIMNTNFLTFTSNSRIGVFQSSPSYTFDVSGTFNATGNSLIGGTLGVTGATTLSGALTVNNATVLNEGSGDFDTRIESDGNANMVFVDASTDRVGIGTNTPSKTLDVNGEVRIGTVSTPPTSLLGKDASNVVGEVTTVAQTGLMTRGAWEASTSAVDGTFPVTHGLGATPVSIIITSAGLEPSFERKLLFEVYARNSTTFSVQAWNLDGSAATSKNVKIYFLAIK